MNYQDLQEAYQEANLPFYEHYKEASKTIQFGTSKEDAEKIIRNLLVDWLEKYAETKAKTKKGGILRKIAHILSGIIPSIVFNAKKSKSK